MITDEMIRYAKSLELPDLMRRRNIQLIPSNCGSAFKCLCPFHEEKTPSLNLNIKEGIWQWHCFGCGDGGTNLDFIMKYEKMDFVSAVRSVAHDMDREPGSFPAINIKIRKEKPVPAVLKDTAMRIKYINLAVEHFHGLLKNPDSKGRQYLEKRGILDESLIDEFKLGFSDGGAGKALNEHRSILKDLGFFKDNYLEVFANCVIFPVLDESRNCSDVYGRRIVDYKDRANHCYNKGDHLGVFNISNVKDAETVILTEGIIDALSIYRSGFKNVTALYGVNGFTDAHKELFRNVKLNKVILVFDRDLPGITGVQRYLPDFTDIEVFMVDLPKNFKDVNALFLKEGPEAVKQQIDKAFIPTADFIENRINMYKMTALSRKIDKAILQNGPLPEALSKIRDAIAADAAGGCSKPALVTPSPVPPSGDPSGTEQLTFSLEAPLPNIQPALSDIIVPRFQFNGSDLIFESSPLTYQIRDVARLKSLNSLRFVITARKNDGQGDVLPITDRIDLYLLRSRTIFENKVAETFKIQSAVIEKDFAVIIPFIENDFKQRKIKDSKESQQAYQMTDEEISEAVKFLKTPNLIKNIIDDLTALGYVGEDDNKLLLYLGATSRKLNKPISMLIRSQSSTGKSFLIDIICNIMPPEDVHKWTSLTPKALYYMAPDALKHKFIAIDERAGMEEAEYPIRSLQSGGTLSLAVPIKNPTNGQITTEQIVKEGPIAYVDGSTDTRVNPENANRCFEIFLDESSGQTRLVQRQQKKAHSLNALNAEGSIEATKRKHRNAQRLLKPVKVIIPFIDLIDFPSDWIRTRRDHDRFLSLIVCIAFLHQYQREHKELNGRPYIEATLKDYTIAYKIAKTVLFNTFQELDKPVFDFFVQLNSMVEQNSGKEGIKPEEYKFTRRTVRQFVRLPDYLVKRYMRILTDLEYFDLKAGSQGSRFEYSLIRVINKRHEIEGLTSPSYLKAKIEAQNAPKKTDSANE